MFPETSNPPLAPVDVRAIDMASYYASHLIGQPIDGDALARREARRRRTEAMAAHPSNLR